LFDDVHAYFYENVLTSYKDYEDRQSESKTGLSIDLRKAIVSATSLFHFREYLPAEHKKSREELSGLCSDYDLLGDIVNASKHKKLTRQWKYLNSSTFIKELKIITMFEDKEGKYSYSEKIISVKLIDGTERNLFNILTNVLNMWYEYLHQIGVLPKKYYKSLHKPSFPLSRAECSDNKLDIEIMQGVRFTQTVRLQKYNYATQEIEIITPSDAKLKMHIYKPNYEVELKLVHKKSKEEIIVPIKLTDKDMIEIDKLKSDQEIKIYLIELSRKQKIIKIDKDFDDIVNETELKKIK